MFTIRPYTPADKQSLIDLFLLNTPAYFHPNEQQDLSEYLDMEIEHYFVAEQDDKIVASGGCNVEDGIGWLSWYIVHPSCHGKGVGSMLVENCLQLLTADIRVTRLIVRTSQLVYPFYSKFGYVLTNTQKDFWGEGFDLYEMEKTMPV